jgi:hypothetical protein
MNTQEQGKLVGEAAMRAALKMAIDALEWLSYSERTAKQLEAIDACNQAISSQSDALATEQVREEPSRVRQNDVPAQGPVDLEEELNNCDGKKCICFAMYQGECACDADWTPEEVVKLRHQLNNTHPHQDGTSPSKWQGLTAKEIASIPLDEYALQTAEKLLKEKNFG